MIDNESHHARVAIFGWISHDRKSADHLAINDIVGGAAGGRWALLGQDLVVIVVIRRAARSIV